MQIKWDVFTKEEQDKIHALIAAGQYRNICHAINMDDLEKEFWVNKIVDFHTPIITPNESKVEKEKQEFLMKGGQINTPELEAEWQAKQDAEKAENLEKSKKLKAEREESMNRAFAPKVSTEHKNEVSEDVQENVEAPKRRGRPPKPPVSETI